MRLKTLISILIIIFCLELFLPNIVYSIDNGYTIESYDINMIVNENNTFEITETIDVNFISSRHGIYRKIPLVNEVTRLDGTRTTNRAKISNIKVNETFDTYNENGDKVIKIGSEYKTITGKHTYIIKYNYNIGKDPLKESDELYFNLIGTEWDTDIKNISFTVTMPKAFDETHLGFSSGYSTSQDSSNISYTVSGNSIIGSVNKTLTPRQGLTIRLTLPEGYFVGTSSNFDYLVLFKIIISIVFVVVAYVIWRKYGKDETVVETVEFFPPSGLNSAEVAFFHKGYVEQKDVISLLIYLANKGYLKIEEYENNSKFQIVKSKEFKIIKLKEYDGSNEDEKMFFNELFKTKDEVTKDDLYNKFYTTVNSIKTNITRKGKTQLYEKESMAKRGIVVAMFVIIWIFRVLPILTNSDVVGILQLAIYFLIFPLIFLYARPNIGTIIINSISFSFMSLIYFMASPYFDFTGLIEFAIETICGIVLLVFLGIMTKRTQYGIELLGKIRGFKNFLELAEKPKLEELVMQDPEYFYNILPYTYALGVSDKWMKKFEDIAIEAPRWYHGHSGFSMYSFNKFMKSTYSSISNTMASSPSSSGSGGGFSGGGSGGGGGGSW